MTDVMFIHADGESFTNVCGSSDQMLLAVAQAAGMPLEGTCEGQMACSTCHVVIDAADFARLPRASDAEEDMLDLATGATRTSRLACQVRLADAGDRLTVHIPSQARNMQGL